MIALLAHRFIELAATAWKIAVLATIAIVAAGLAFLLVPVAFVVIWCLEALHFLKLID
jgi:hypothetical protein